jgi:hypothetical protein
LIVHEDAGDGDPHVVSSLFGAQAPIDDLLERPGVEVRELVAAVSPALDEAGGLEV